MMNKEQSSYDLVIIGGGINGVGIAADAAGRGLTVLLVEQDDLASATSSNSSKLIHGGLRYLENYQFRLVKEALAEREILLQNAKHIMRPLTFRLPHQPHLRPTWMIKLGLFLYDHLAKRITLPDSRTIHFNQHSPLKPNLTHGFEYSDVWVDDARLVVFNALAAQQHGAVIKTRTRCIKAQRQINHWQVTLAAKSTDTIQVIKTKGVVNAAGPWACQLFDQVFTSQAPRQLRLVKGSHIIVPQLHKEKYAYILQNRDKRIVFVIPYENKFSLIGTTDVDYQGDPRQVAIDQDEIHYLLKLCNDYFNTQIHQQDILKTFSGVRPLVSDHTNNPQSVTRDYTLTLDTQQQLPLLSILGGKITTYRRLAETALQKLAPFYPHMGKAWTATNPLPGAQFPSLQSLTTQLSDNYPWLTSSQCQRYASCYGTNAYIFLQGIQSKTQLGIHFGNDLYQVEVDYLITHEWAMDVEDIIWRRTKLGLHLKPYQIEQLRQYLKNKVHNQVA